jgi:hypothetical protein
MGAVGMQQCGIAPSRISKGLNYSTWLLAALRIPLVRLVHHVSVLKSGRVGQIGIGYGESAGFDGMGRDGLGRIHFG